MAICNLTMPGSIHLDFYQKKPQDIVYTPMGGSPTINDIVYAHFKVHLNSRSRLPHWFFVPW